MRHRHDISKDITEQLDRLQERLDFFRNEEAVRNIIISTYKRDLEKLSRAGDHGSVIRYHVWMVKYEAEACQPKIRPVDATKERPYVPPGIRPRDEGGEI